MVVSTMDPATSAKSVSSSMENLIDVDEINVAYQHLCKKEDEANDDLQILLQQQSSLEEKMISLHSMLPNLQLVQNDSQQLEGMISFTSTLAENVSSKVRQLDVAKSRVTSCMQRVEDVLDLKFCTDGVQTALQDEDYEKASAHVHRFLSLDENVLRMSADANEGSTLDTSFKMLHESRAKLKSIVHNKFDAAVHSGDVASVERFFKIFPLIGERESGLEKFSKYLSSQLSNTADKNLKLALAAGPDDKRANVLYADTLTLLFESIARVVEVHQPLVETYYGAGRMYILLQHLQRECDRQTRAVLDHFRRNRDFDNKVQLVQQHLMYQKQGLDKVDPKELDILLAEVTLLNTRAELYLRFLRRRIVNDLEAADYDEDALAAKVKDVDVFITSCVLSRQMQELIGNYIMMEEYFMKESVIKAVNMDTVDERSMMTSMMDDVFFIVKKCIRRALSSSSVDVVCAMLNHACTLLEQDFREVLYSRLRQGFPSGFDLTAAYNLVQSSFQHGRLQSADVETEKAKLAFLTTLNNSEMSLEYVQTLRTNIEEDVDKLYNKVTEQGHAKLQSCLQDLGSVSNKFKDVLDFGFSQLAASAIKPRIKPWTDTFLSANHSITEEDFTNFEANDPWVQNFIVNLDSLIMMFKSSLTSTNYDTLVSHVSSEITAQLEKAVLKTSFNRLGGLQFDKELRSLVGYLTSVTTWTIRDKFARLTQMATILNLEKVSEILDYWGPNSGPLTWRLTPAEVRLVLSRRTDFRPEDIKRLKL